MRAGERASACPLEESPGVCDALTGLRCSEVGACPNLSSQGRCGEWAVGTSSAPIAESTPGPVTVRDHAPRSFWWRRTDAHTRVAEAGAKQAELATDLMKVGIGLAVVIPLYEILYGTLTGSAPPVGWPLMALPGSVITLAAALNRASR